MAPRKADYGTGNHGEETACKTHDVLPRRIHPPLLFAERCVCVLEHNVHNVDRLGSRTL
jgi:hypothetical protein